MLVLNILGGMEMLKKIKELLGIKPKIVLTSHEIAITVMYLNRDINNLEQHAIGKDDPWCINHDIEILKKVIKMIDR